MWMRLQAFLTSILSPLCVHQDKMGDVDKLITKHGKDAFKFSKLITKMVKKYPELIKVVRSKEQDMMDKIRQGNFDASDLDAEAPKTPPKPADTSADEDGVDVVEVDADVHDEM
eukprot:m.190495 g.190495  ORF g.190495 m.190495 type:complete len:114 (+) comp18563_c0_seq4:968-1309(+)